MATFKTLKGKRMDITIGECEDGTMLPDGRMIYKKHPIRVRFRNKYAVLNDNEDADTIKKLRQHKCYGSFFTEVKDGDKATVIEAKIVKIPEASMRAMDKKTLAELAVSYGVKVTQLDSKQDMIDLIKKFYEESL